MLLAAGVLLALLLASTAFTLTRLRRLAGRVRRAREVLDAALLRRAELAAALAREQAGELGAELAVPLGEAAAGARAPSAGDREAAENRLGRLLRRVPGSALTPELADAGMRVALARRFYNDAVRDTRALRRGRLARVLRLHGRRPLPRYFDIDDGLDAVLTGPAPRSSGPQGRG
nr:LemA family protein [Modestobacter versicolor]